MGGVCSTHGTAEKIIHNFGHQAIGGKALRNFKNRWEENIRANLKEIKIEDA
jgi:hypothetical protein